MVEAWSVSSGFLGTIYDEYTCKILRYSSISTGTRGIDNTTNLTRSIPVNALDIIERHLKRILHMKLQNGEPELHSDKLWAEKMYGKDYDIPMLRNQATSDLITMSKIRLNRTDIMLSGIGAMGARVESIETTAFREMFL